MVVGGEWVNVTSEGLLQCCSGTERLGPPESHLMVVGACVVLGPDQGHYMFF